MKRTIIFVATVTLVSGVTSFVLSAVAASPGREANTTFVGMAALGLCGGLACLAPAAAAPSRHYDYSVEYALGPADYLAVQRRNRVLCMRMEAGCRVMLSRTREGDGGPATLTVEVPQSMSLQVLERFGRTVEDAGGDIRRHEVGITQGANATGGIATITLTYVSLAGFFEQTAEALRAFGPSLMAGLVSMVFLLPMLAPWLAGAALIVWGVRKTWRKRRRVPAGPYTAGPAVSPD